MTTPDALCPWDCARCTEYERGPVNQPAPTPPDALHDCQTSIAINHDLADKLDALREAAEALTKFEWGRNGQGVCSWCGWARGTYDSDAHGFDCPLAIVRAATQWRNRDGETITVNVTVDPQPDTASRELREAAIAVLDSWERGDIDNDYDRFASTYDALRAALAQLKEEE